MFHKHATFGHWLRLQLQAQSMLAWDFQCCAANAVLCNTGNIHPMQFILFTRCNIPLGQQTTQTTTKTMTAHAYGLKVPAYPAEAIDQEPPAEAVCQAPPLA